ncbi:MAG: glycosyltransferase family 4 protein [Planctomycetota bacterium]|nr:glycosyltransferase family 4 protein [Planctomycetota bacterium]
MKILHVVHGFPPEHEGGTELYVARLAHAQADAGHDVVVVAGTAFDQFDGFVEQPAPSGDVRLLRITKPGHMHDRWDHGASEAVDDALADLLQRERPDVVHVHHWLRLTRAVVATAKRAGVRVVVTAHDAFATCPRIFRVREDEAFCQRELSVASCLSCVPRDGDMDDSYVAAELDHFMADMVRELDLADAVIAPSEAQAQLLARFAPPLAGRVEVVPHAWLVESCGGGDVGGWTPDSGRPLRVAHWGHLLPFKGVHLLLESIRDLADDRVEVVLWGTADDLAYRERLDALASGLRIERRANFTHEDLAGLRADVAVFPTMAHESYSFVVSEAFALGLPVLASHRGALPERVGSAGWTFAPGDVSGLTALLRRLLDEPDQLVSMRDAIPPPRSFDAHAAEVARTYAPEASDEPLCVLFVVHQFLPAHVAGTEVYAYNLAKQLVALGHRVVIYTTESDGDAEHSLLRRKEYDGLEVWEAVHNNWFPDFEHSYADAEKERQFGEVLDAVQPDVVHAQHLFKHSMGYVALAKQRGLSVVYTLHEFLLMCPRNGWLVRPGWELCEGPEPAACAECVTFLPAPSEGSYLDAVGQRRRVIDAALAEVDLFISPSRFLRERFVNEGMIDADRILYSDNGMPTSGYAETPHARVESVRFGFVGTIAEWKGVHLIVEAMNGLPVEGVECAIWGVLEYFEDYVAQLKRDARHPGISFHGRFDNAQVAAILGDIDCLIVPSLWFENSPITIHEAFLAGVPVIAGDRGGMAESVEHGVNGLHFSMHDSSDLQRQMQRVLDEPGLLERLSDFPEIKDIATDASLMEQRYRTLLAGKVPER